MSSVGASCVLGGGGCCRPQALISEKRRYGRSTREPSSMRACEESERLLISLTLCQIERKRTFRSVCLEAVRGQRILLVRDGFRTRRRC